MSALDPFAKPNPASEHERFDPTQGGMRQIPSDDDNRSLIMITIVCLALMMFVAGLVSGLGIALAIEGWGGLS